MAELVPRTVSQVVTAAMVVMVVKQLVLLEPQVLPAMVVMAAPVMRPLILQLDPMVLPVVMVAMLAPAPQLDPPVVARVATVALRTRLTA
jgi:hypothetical protein